MMQIRSLAVIAETWIMLQEYLLFCEEDVLYFTHSLLPQVLASPALHRVSYRGQLASQLSKLQGMAGPGQVVVSQPAAEQLAALLAWNPSASCCPALPLLPGEGEGEEDEVQEAMARQRLVVKPLGNTGRSKGVYQCCLVSTCSEAIHAADSGHGSARSGQQTPHPSYAEHARGVNNTQ
jgi:hypothetical protein